MIALIRRLDMRACQQPQIEDEFAIAFTSWIDQVNTMHAIDRRNTNQFADLVKDAFDHAALSTLPTVSYIAKKPWI